MKTKNNVQKTILKSMAIVSSFVLITLTVNAQDFWRSVLENNSLNEIAMIMVNANTESFPAKLETENISSAVFTEESEAPLVLESWMINKEFFGSNLSTEVKTETHLVLESWMTDNSYFNTSLNIFEEETECPLELGNWMVDENFGTTVANAISQQINMEPEQESALELEPWMLANNKWK